MTPAPESASRRLTRAAAFFLLTVLVAVATRLPFYLEQPFFNVDEGTLATGAMIIADGGTPYHDFWDTRGPLTFYVYAGVFALAGAGNMLAVHLTVIAVVVLTALLLMALGHLLWGAWPGRLAGPVYALASAAFLKTDMLAANIEIYMVLFSTSGVLLYVLALPRRRVPLFAASGLLFGLAFLTKQPALVTALGLAALLALFPRAEGAARGRRLLPLLAFAAGFLVPVLLTVAAYASRGMLESFTFGFWTYSSRYFIPAMPMLERLRNALLAPLPMLLWNPWVWLGGLAGAVLIVRSGGSPRRLQPGDAVLVWAITSLAGASASGRGFGHYYIQFLPALSLLSALSTARLMAWWSGRAGGRRGWWPAAALASAVLLVHLLPVFFILQPPGSTLKPSAFHSADADVTPTIAKLPKLMTQQTVRYVSKHSAPGDRIFVWGFAPSLYPLTGRLPASRFIYGIYLTGLIPWTNTAPGLDTSDSIVPGSWSLLKEDLHRNRPRFIIDTSPSNYLFWGKYPAKDFPPLRSFLRRSYRTEKLVRTPRGRVIFRIYGLRSASRG